MDIGVAYLLRSVEWPFPLLLLLGCGAVCDKCQPPEWFFKVIFWLGYCNSTMNPVIYAMSSREFKRAFIRILKCQCRHRSRSFVWENASTSPSTTEMNKLYTSVRRFTKRDVPSVALNNRRIHGTPFFNSNDQTNNHRDTLQVSMQLLHDKQRKETAETMMISDDESAIMEQSDDEKSDIDNGSVIVSFPRSTDESEESKRLMEHKGVWEEEEDEGEDDDLEDDPIEKEELVRLPCDVVINCEDDQVTAPSFLVNDSYPSPEDQIMWL
ncbi:hypothetical protein CAPTEDRAFT_195667 [Capitella teleta]|uniref:G-protein coupled receptors family 1 profile domain-containing protein n=1 Tax=Capitella teleta TaxID=283909 RepID=X1ZVC7_CAPTE|nr:hypothetical protein CAPTEDRAFT_195667 [Capitella teleta]|eukprot:ELT88381.1 hypothetical protein CAPTEDRAFT_195667 [Capitella teleta]